MSNYTFRTSSCYTLNTHEVTFTSTEIIIKLTSTGVTVYQGNFATAGIAIMCQNNDFCVGSLTDNGTFSMAVDFSNKAAKMWLEEQSGQNKFIGSNNQDNPDIWHKYDLNQCPVRLTSASGIVNMACPCQSDKGPCTHDCYTYG